jgi:hypothetical protein
MSKCVIAKFTAASSFSSVPSIPSATASSTTSRRAQSGDDTAPFARLKAKSKDMRPKSKVSDWLAKKSEDGSVDSDDSQSEDEHAGPKSKEVHSDTEDEDDDDVDHGDNDEFDLELVSKKVLRSRPTDRIHYLRHDLHLGVTGSSVFFAGSSVNANLVVLDLQRSLRRNLDKLSMSCWMVFYDMETRRHTMRLSKCCFRR